MRLDLRVSEEVISKDNLFCGVDIRPTDVSSPFLSVLRDTARV